MKKLLVVFLGLLLFALPVKAQLLTNLIYGTAINAAAQYQPVIATAKLVPPFPTQILNYQLLWDGYQVYATTNGLYTFTNLQAGYYSCNLSGNPGVTFLFSVYNGASGAIPISSLVNASSLSITNPYYILLGAPTFGTNGAPAVWMVGVGADGRIVTNAVPSGGGGGGTPLASSYAAQIGQVSGTNVITGVSITTNASIAGLLADTSTNSPHYIVSYYGTNYANGASLGGGFFNYIPPSMTNNLSTNFGTIFAAQAGGLWQRQVASPYIMQAEWFGLVSSTAGSAFQTLNFYQQWSNCIASTPDNSLILVPTGSYGTDPFQVNGRFHLTIQGVNSTHGGQNGASGPCFYYCESYQTNVALCLITNSGYFVVNGINFVSSIPNIQTTNVCQVGITIDQGTNHTVTTTFELIEGCCFNNGWGTNNANWIGVNISPTSTANVEFTRVWDCSFFGGGGPVNQFNQSTNSGTAIMLGNNANAFNGQFKDLEWTSCGQGIGMVNASFDLDGALTEYCPLDFALTNNSGTITIRNVRAESPGAPGLPWIYWNGGRGSLVVESCAIDTAFTNNTPMIYLQTNYAAAFTSLDSENNYFGVQGNAQVYNFNGYTDCHLISKGNVFPHSTVSGVGYQTATNAEINDQFPTPAGIYFTMPLSTFNGTNTFVFFSNSPAMIGIYPSMGAGLTVDTNSIVRAGAFWGSLTNATGANDTNKIANSGGSGTNETFWGNLTLNTNFVNGGNELYMKNGFVAIFGSPDNSANMTMGINGSQWNNTDFAFGLSGGRRVLFYDQSEVDIYGYQPTNTPILNLRPEFGYTGNLFQTVQTNQTTVEFAVNSNGVPTGDLELMTNAAPLSSLGPNSVPGSNTVAAMIVALGTSSANGLYTNSTGNVTQNNLRATNMTSVSTFYVTNPVTGEFLSATPTNGGFVLYVGAQGSAFSNSLAMFTNGVSTFTGTNGVSFTISNGVVYASLAGSSNYPGAIPASWVITSTNAGLQTVSNLFILGPANGGGLTNIPYSSIVGAPANNIPAGMTNVFVSTSGQYWYSNTLTHALTLVDTNMNQQTISSNAADTVQYNLTYTANTGTLGVSNITVMAATAINLTNTGVASIPTNTASWSRVYYPLTLGSSYTTPPQRGYIFADVLCTNGNYTCLSNMTSHDVAMTIQSVASLKGTNDFKLQLYTQPGDIVTLTNLQVSGVTLYTNYWIGF